jgi:hypothetical protein
MTFQIIPCTMELVFSILMHWNRPAHSLQTVAKVKSAVRPGRVADDSPPSAAEVKNAWSYNSTPPIRRHDEVLC